VYYERLSLEILAVKSHWQILSPPTLAGRSGAVHRFDFVAMDGQYPLAFDIYERLDETDVIKTFIKKFDTGACAFILCITGKLSEGAGKLAAEYGLDVLHPGIIEPAFREIVESRSQSRRLAPA
jgi:hypothetical protein